MKFFRENIWADGEYDYRAAYGFVPNIHAYLHEDGIQRDCMIVVPGGGYCMCVPSEAQVPAMEFFDRGMNVFVLSYTTDITMSVPLGAQPMNDAARAVRFIRSRASRYEIEGKKIIMCGFSAGAHVIGSLAVHFNDIVDPNPAYEKISARPDGVILSYPVITTGEFTHIYSVWALVGKNASEKEKEYFSLEKQVTGDMPPCFIWQTDNDNLVPVENSFLFAKALREKKVPYSLHIFPSGFHGLSVPNEDFFKGNFPDFTMEQVKLAVEAVKEGRGIDVSPERVKELKEQFPDPLPEQENDPSDFTEEKDSGEEEEKPLFTGDPLKLFSDVRLWPELAFEWLKKL